MRFPGSDSYALACRFRCKMLQHRPTEKMQSPAQNVQPFNIGTEMAKNRLPKSIRKHLRKEKAEIRRHVPDAEEAERSISKLVAEARGGVAGRMVDRAVGRDP